MPNHPINRPTSAIEAQHSLGLRIIAIYKAIKTVGLLLTAAVAFRLERQENFDHFVRWLKHLSLTDTNGLREKLVDLLQQWGHTRLIAVGLVAIGYAIIFATEGTGLWLRKHWAEWFTVIATGSLIPIEIYEALHHRTWLKLSVLIANVAIVIYLIRIAIQPRVKQKPAS